MSEEMVNGKNVLKNDIQDNQGFSSALYIKVPLENVESRLKEATDVLDNLKLGDREYDQNPTLTKRPSESYQNFISSDLLKRLEENSPIKTRNTMEFTRRISEVFLVNCEKNETEFDSPQNDEVNLYSKNNKMEVESKEINREDGQSSPEYSGSLRNNNSRINYKLKSQILGRKGETNRLQEKSRDNLYNNKNQIFNGKEYKEEPESLFRNSMNFSNMNKDIESSEGNTYYSPPYKTKQVKSDTSPLYTYYDGTVECLSQNFYDELKKTNTDKFMSTYNYIKKEQQQPIILPEESSNSSINTSQSNLYSKVTDDQSSFNSIQLPFNIFNANNNQNFLNVNNFAQYFTRAGMNNVNVVNNNNSFNSGIGNSNKDSQYFDFSQQSNDSYLISRSNLNMNMTGNGISNSTPVNRNNMRNCTLPNQTTPYQNNNMMIMNDITDEYTVEMFGRKGWICEKCNNFNYETRQKCNRCSVIKTPKKIKKQINRNPNENSNGDDDDEDSDKKNKKKPFVERVGDWVCIKCKNLNFSFRVVCNRCQLPKIESDKMFETYMSNLMNYVQYNELMHQQILQGQNHYEVNGNMNSNSAPGYFNNHGYQMNNNHQHQHQQQYNNNYSNLKTQNYNKNVQPNPNFSNGANYSSSMSMSNVSNSVVGNNGNMSNHYGMSSVLEDEDYYNEGM